MELVLKLGLLLSSIVGGVRARDDYHIKCTLPDNSARFVFSPHTRGTLDILWSCLFTIAACTWTIQHLNVPEQRGNRQPGWRGDVWWSLKGLWSNGKWMIATTIAPEYILGKAFGDLLAAYESRGIMKQKAAEDGVEWSLTHGFFANMGGFMLTSTPCIGHQAEAETTTENSSESGAVHLTASEIYALRQRGILQKLPKITTADINDRSKGDIFVKTLAVIQVFWMMLQVLIRDSRKIDIAPLEVAVMAFSICAVITYALLFKKPKRSPSRNPTGEL